MNNLIARLYINVQKSRSKTRIASVEVLYQQQ